MPLNNPLPRIAFLAIVITALLSTSSCSYIALSRRTKFVCPTENVKVSISETIDGEYTEVTNRRNSVKLNHFKKGYFVRQERDGYVPHTYELSRSSINPLNRLDKVLLITTDVFVTIFLPLHYLVGTNSNYGQSATALKAQSIVLFTALGIGVAGWGAVIPAPKRLFPKTVELPPLIQIITKDTNQLSIVTGKHTFNFGKGGITVRDYATMNQFNKGYGYKSRDTIDDFKFIESLKLHNDISEMLSEAKYGIDSTTATLESSLRLRSWTRGIIFMSSENKLRCELKNTWGLETMDQLQQLYDKTFLTNSEWLPYDEAGMSKEEREAGIKLALKNAMDASLKKFLALDTIQSILSAPVPLPLKEKEQISLEAGSRFAGSVSEAVKAVITIVTDKGHGSGCVVTPDGYIITNAHVVEDDTVNIKAILSNNLDKKIPLKFLRMNEAVDLALLKLDTTALVPLKLAGSEKIEVGADVYAIGTPADVELGQTVTRGIISGKRKFGGHQMIQTDVAISPGNSGGALIRADGSLCGIVTSALDGSEINDIGFAIPAPIVEESLKISLKY